ncbi:MAG: ABC transporter ATP-binding protein [Methanomassiliicoccales archaeon]
MLVIDNIEVLYAQVQVLRGVTLDANEREIVSLLGSNASGKSTTVNAISGVVPVTKGSIRFMDIDITHMPPHMRVAMGLIQVPEGRRIFPMLTVEENLIMGSYLKKPKSRRRESLERAMRMFPILADRRKQAAGTLSGGEQQMLAVARGLMSLPSLLVLDEPSMGLAPLVVEDLFRVVREINADGITIFLVEQNVSHALAISNRAFVLEEGRIALSGTGQELLGNPHIKKLYLGL